MESKVAVTALFIVTLVSSAVVHAQQTIQLKLVDGTSTVPKPDAFVVPSIINTKPDGWKDQHQFVEAPNQFTKMFQARAAEAGNPWRIPMYALPFARGYSPPTAVGMDMRPKISANQPNLVKDVGALISSLRTDN